MRLARPLLAVALLCLMSLPVMGGNQQMLEYTLFNGSNTSAAVDTVELASAWIPIRGASRVMIRTWSNGSGTFSAGGDSLYVDSLTTFKVVFSDSICCTVTGPKGLSIPSAADSFMIDATVASGLDTTKTGGIRIALLPINKALAPTTNGSGIITQVFVLTPGVATAEAGDGVFVKQYMRVRTQALRRSTPGGFLMTSGFRAAGVRGLRMRAYVYHMNH